MVSDTLNLYCKVTKYFSNTQIFTQLFLKKKLKWRSLRFLPLDWQAPALRLASSRVTIGGLADRVR